MTCRISVVIPVWNGGPQFTRCLAAIAASQLQPLECIVVDDGSTDDSIDRARAFGSVVLKTGKRSGPAVARNLGASVAQGDILLFLDSDVAVHHDTIGRIVQRFQDQDLGVVIGSYDAAPSDIGFVSQYRNLLHCFTHQNAAEQTCTFWGACGAIRKRLFLESGGFAETYTRPAVEDIELGYRLCANSVKMVLDRKVQVTHLKRWTFLGMLWCDFRHRAIPWTELILRNHKMPDDLNVRSSQRFSLMLVWLAVLAMAIAPWGARAECCGVLSAACLAGSVWIDRKFYLFLKQIRGFTFASAAIPLYLLFHLYSAVGFLCGAAVYLWQTMAGGPPIAVEENSPARQLEQTSAAD